MVLLPFIPEGERHSLMNAYFITMSEFARSRHSGLFFAYNTPFLSVASGEDLKAGQSFDAGD
ncbi:hypothetical protein EDI85_21420 [Salmonella enterica]|nr:hypothetical protein [Salmonella enterica]